MAASQCTVCAARIDVNGVIVNVGNSQDILGQNASLRCNNTGGATVLHNFQPIGMF